MHIYYLRSLKAIWRSIYERGSVILLLFFFLSACLPPHLLLILRSFFYFFFLLWIPYDIRIQIRFTLLT